MRALVQVGIAAWVDPEQVVAVEWDPVEKRPRVLLQGGGLVVADSYRLERPTESEGEPVKRLIEKLTSAVGVATAPADRGPQCSTNCPICGGKAL